MVAAWCRANWRAAKDWLGASVHRRVAAGLLSVTLAFTFLVNTASYLAASWQLRRSVAEAMAVDAARLADRVAIPLTTIAGVVASMASRPVLAHALADPARHKAEAQGFLRALPTPSGFQVTFTLCEAAGRPIASSDPADEPRPVEAPFAARVIEAGAPVGELTRVAGRQVVRMAWPVRHRSRPRPVGLILADLELAPLLAGGPAPIEDGSRWLVDGAGRVLTREQRGDHADQPLLARAAVPVPPPLDALGLAVEVTRSRGAAFRPLLWLSLGFTAGTGLMVLLALVVARWLARRLTRPIRDLADAAGRLTAGGRLDAGLLVEGEDEVGRLAGAFNGMLAQLHRETEARVAELRERNEVLQALHAESKRLEVELHQAQKLEAVGQLASGIAHEINTPIQYIGDNTRFLQEAVAALSARAQRLQEVAAAHAPPEVNAALAEEADGLDLEYILEQSGPAIRRTLDGAQRVATIVRAMKEFAHPDQKEMVATDLNRAIRATLEVARNEYRYVADVETDLQPLPAVTCHPGEVNQVLLNVIVNAAHAIGGEAQGTGRRGLIEVRTRAQEAFVEIEVADDGPGIPDGIRDRVFEPFFTTKEVGRGTGQGLAIARSVVERHGGSIRFQSAQGLGTTFSIRLPVTGPAQRSA